MTLYVRALVCLLSGLPASTHAGDFLQIKNENPLLRGLYLPMPSDMRATDGPTLSASVAVANTINVEASDGERLFVDGESTTLRLSYDASLAPDWRYRLTLPLLHDAGGSFDSLIDRWHGWFGLPRGQRPNFPRNRLAYSYSGLAAVNVGRSHTSLGDAAAELGWFLRDDATQSLSFWAGFEAPTGKASDATGNGAWDASLWVHAALRGARWRLGGEAGLLRPFGDDLFAAAARRTAVFGRTAVSWTPSPAWSLRLQLEAQSARLNDTQIRFLGPSVVLSAGAQVRLGRQWSAQLGFSEDAAADTAPDVTFFLGLRRTAFAH